MAINFWKREQKSGPEIEPEQEKVVDDVLLQALRRGETITREKVLTLPIVNSAVDFIANCIATMPVKLYKVKNNKVDEVENDNRVKLLNGDTGDTLDACQMKKAMVEDYLLGKGGYCYIKWQRNEVVGLYYVEDKNIGIIKNYHPIFKFYQIQVFDKNYKSYDFIKLLRNTKDGASGEGLTCQVSKALETAYQTLMYQLGMVATGGNKRGFLKAVRKLGQEEINTLKKAWSNLYKNNNAENVVVLNNGLEFQEASASAVETQLNESKKTLKEEIEALFHIYPNDFNRTFKEAISPIVKAFEVALNRDLLLENEKKNHYFKFDMEEMTRVSAKERYEAYSIAKNTGFMTLNEIRKAENMEFIEGLDVINVGLGAVLYDTNKQVYYTPNTDTVSSMNDADNSMGAGMEEDATAIDEMAAEGLGGDEELEGIDSAIDELEKELLGSVTSVDDEEEELEERYAEIAKLRNKATKNALKEEYDNKYLEELDKIKADSSMQKTTKKRAYENEHDILNELDLAIECKKKRYNENHDPKTGRFVSKSGTSGVGGVINNSSLDEVGESLHALNKEAKKIRDVIWKMNGWQKSPTQKIADEVIMGTLNLTKEEYKAKLAEPPKELLGRPYTVERQIIDELEYEKDELYNLKEKVINKALDSGILPLGRHTFANKHDNVQSYYYMKIGQRGFHFTGNYEQTQKMRKTAKEKGVYKEGTWIKQVYETNLGEIKGKIPTDYTIKFTPEMRKILENYINEGR